MRVVLLNPWDLVIDNNPEHLGTFLPLACLYVASAAMSAKHEVSIIDASIYGHMPFINKNVAFRSIVYGKATDVKNMPNASFVGASLSPIFGMLRLCNPDVIGLSITFSSLHYFLRGIVDLLKANLPNVKIIIGGAHATVAPEFTLMESNADYVIAGEGEVAFVKLLNALEKGEEPRDIPGVYYRKDNEIQFTPFEIIENIDSIPFPLYQSIPLEYYYGVQGCKRAHMITSRGCPFNCTFCSSPFISKRKWRGHSPERVFAEMQYLVNLDAQEIFFEDDNMAIHKDRFVSIIEGIIECRWNLQLRVHNSLHVSTLTPEIIKLMHRAGFEWISVSPESGNERVAIEEMGKTFSPADARKVVEYILKEGMHPVVNLVIGMPNETWKEIQDTIDYGRELKELGVNDFQLAIATPLIGSKIRKDLIEQGRLKDEIPITTNYFIPSYDGIDWKADDLKNLRDNAAKELNSNRKGTR